MWLSNGDRIRGMTDEELAGFLAKFADSDDRVHYCRFLPECEADLETDTLIPLERCEGCLLGWLRAPAEK